MRIQPLAQPFSRSDADRCLKQWSELAQKQDDPALAGWMARAVEPSAPEHPLLLAIFGNSPYLSRLLLGYPHLLRDIEDSHADKTYAELLKELQTLPAEGGKTALMRHLRVSKNKMALLTAIADITQNWPLERVTQALSEFAQQCLSISLDSILTESHARGEIVLPHPDRPAQDSGLFVLGMGKLGGRELNYSSDIDLIVFFERDKLGYKGRQTEQHFMNKLAHELVHIMQERTADGYVFRTDLRLRPDPASTPPAINTEAAYYYYESVGQNWERAAMIKARPVAGDIPAGERFMTNLAPFMWRRSLDFAAINDIHSIKRQMDTRQSRDIQIKNHNIKLGIGGIREIEFYVQIHQLIWGGREPSLRLKGTCETLSRLAAMGLIGEEQRQKMLESYGFLRTLEHRLQMVADEQTHSLPDSDPGVARIAAFMGYTSVEAFSADFFGHIQAVHGIYASSFQSAEKLGDEGNLVFTGVSHDPDTLETLRRMGYENPETVSQIVMGWHHGSRRATRTKRARELLTELMPTLLKRLAETANPDAAFLKFNEFLCNLPAGVQLFSLFNNNPELLGLIADILGSAPTLAERLSKSPALLDAVMYGDFYGPLAPKEALTAQLRDILTGPVGDFENRIDYITRFRNEKQFQAGVHMLKRMVTAAQAGKFLSDLADVALAATLEAVEEEFRKTYGTIKGSRFAIIALGKLGSQEMTFSSDIDLVFVYDVPDFEALSDGEKGYTASVYFNRLAQRLVNTLSAVGSEGRLNEVDTRLRPSGKQGLLAVSVQALKQYFEEMAWTFEYMAFTRARVAVADDDTLKTQLAQFITAQLIKPRDAVKLKTDVHDMRERVEKEFGTKNPWDIKYVRGGLMDIDFMAQYLALLHAPATKNATPGSGAHMIRWLKNAGHIDGKTADELLESDRFLGQIFNMLRLCCDSAFDENDVPPGLKKLLFDSVELPDFDTLKKRLIAVEQAVYAHYITLFGE